MQCAVVEYARDLCGLTGANSTEFDPKTPAPVIYLMEKWFDYRSQRTERRNVESDMGGTMRLGAYPCNLIEGSHAFEAYGVRELSERHRHRYEFNNAYRALLSQHGMRFTGTSPDGELVEIVEIENHPWFLGCQFHPEFKSRPTDPHPLFKGFIAAAIRERRSLFPGRRRQVAMTRKVSIGGVEIGARGPLLVIAGPCVIEDKETMMQTAAEMRDICASLGLPFVFKSSYDKANRSSVIVPPRPRHRGRARDAQRDKRRARRAGLKRRAHPRGGHCARPRCSTRCRSRRSCAARLT